MLTVDFDRLPAVGGTRFLDVGCGRGRHTFEALKRGCSVVSLDLDAEALGEVSNMSALMRAQGEIGEQVAQLSVRADALCLPFGPATFDVVVACEVLEHLPDDTAAMAEVARVLKPGGLAAVSVPRWWPERICWMLSLAYHDNDGGHVRIYRAGELSDKLAQCGLASTGSHHAHALHVPYWWMTCAFSASEHSLLPRLYHRMLVWDITRRPAPLRVLERVLDPLMGKSLVVYLRKEPGSAMAHVG